MILFADSMSPKINAFLYIMHCSVVENTEWFIVEFSMCIRVTQLHISSRTTPLLPAMLGTTMTQYA